MLKILVMVLFFVLLLISIGLLIYILKDRLSANIKEAQKKNLNERKLREVHGAFEIWEIIDTGLLKLGELSVIPEKSSCSKDDWQDYHQYIEKIRNLLTKIKGYIETHPDQAHRIKDVEQAVKMSGSLLLSYRSYLSFGGGSSKAHETSRIARDGLAGIIRVLNGYIEYLFKSKNLDLTTEMDVLLKWYDANKGDIHTRTNG